MIPATYGAAIEVPDKRAVAVGAPIKAERMLTPGAQTSKIAPKFEKGALAFLESIAPMVLAVETLAGDTFDASAFELPAETVK